MKRLKYLSIIMMILVNSLALSQGYTRISSQLKQKNDLPFPLLDSYDLLGGAVSGRDRTALPQERRIQGMLFLDSGDGTVYQLVGGTDDIHWQLFSSGELWLKTESDIYYNDGDVKVGSNLFIDQVRFGGEQSALNGLRIGNLEATSAGSNILLGLNHETGAGWDIFKPDLSGATGNVFIGIDNIIQPNITGDNNIAIGKWTGYNLTEGTDNIYLGQSAGENNSLGSNNISLGFQAGKRSSGDWNIDLGIKAGYGYNMSGSKNINIGFEAGYIFGTPGIQTSNISIGEYAGWKYAGDSTVMIGVNAGVEGVGNKNYMIGFSAGRNSDGNINLYLGRNAGRSHRGDSCVFIGDGVGYTYNGSNKVLIDIMYRTDGSYMIDLDGAQNKRVITFNGKKLIAKTDEFLLQNIPGNITRLKIFSRSDSTIITSDRAIKFEGTDLVINTEIISNGLNSFSRSLDLDNDKDILIAKGQHGWGTVQAGDDESFAQFRFSSQGQMVLFNQTANVIDSDEEGRFCIYYNGEGIVLKNRLGAVKRVNFTINYTNPAK